MKRLRSPLFGARFVMGFLVAARSLGATGPVDLESEASQRAAFHFNKATALMQEDSVPAFSPLDLSRPSVAEQIRSVGALGGDLSVEENAALISFLRRRPAETPHKPPGIHVLKNEIMNVLRRQHPALEGLTEVLISLHEDQEQDLVVRDYAVQHLLAWYEQGAAGSLTAKTRIRALLLRTVRDGTTIAGTALLGMHRLTQSEQAFDPQVIDSLALQMAQFDCEPAASRMSALQVCAERGVAAALPTAEILVRAPTDTALRVTAIAAVGALGGVEQAALLQLLKREDNEPLRTAIEAALKQLKQRAGPLAVNPDRT